MQERQTKQKTVIYDALCALDHPTATEVYARLQETNPSISRATVFRVLSGFAESGKALEIRMAGSDVRYDYNVAPHYHVHCTKCGRVADIAAPRLAGLEKEIGGEVCGFSVENFSVEFFGICPDCKESGCEGCTENVPLM
jgi:Fe2+ or Zn2+ uptake regulation protein